jgi:hypothetical protein
MINEFTTVDRHFYINNCIGSFFKGVLNWFGDVFYPRINYKVIGTYEKSVEYFNKLREKGQEIDHQIFPSLTLDPDLNIRPAEVGGKFLWQSESLAPGLGSLGFDRIQGLESQDIDLRVVFSRYEGDMQMMFWFDSVYEYFDIRMFLFQWSSGYNRRLRPKVFESFIILPDTINDYSIPTLNGPVPIDWSQSDRVITKICNTGQNNYVLPVTLNPMFWFTDISDGSTKYGGDSVAEYKLLVNCSFEIDLPTYFVLTPFSGRFGVDMTVRMDATYSRYGTNPLEINGQLVKTLDVPRERFLTTDSSTPLHFDIFKERAYYTFTEEDQNNWDSDNPQLFINNPFDPTVKLEQMSCVSYPGLLYYGQHWERVEQDGQSKIWIKIEPKQDEIFELFLYE